MADTPQGSAADETPDQAALDSINAVVEHARPDENFGSGLAQGSTADLTAAQRSLSVRLSGLLGDHGHELMKIYPDKKASECMTLAARDLDVFMDRIREAFDV